MARYERGIDEHLIALRGFEMNVSSSNSSDDFEVEIVSTYDATEFELVQLGEYVRLESDSDEESEEEPEEKENDYPKIVWYFIQLLMIRVMIFIQ